MLVGVLKLQSMTGYTNGVLTHFLCGVIYDEHQQITFGQHRLWPAERFPDNICKKPGLFVIYYKLHMGKTEITYKHATSILTKAKGFMGSYDLQLFPKKS
jgi:hypothetical protein